MLFRNSELYIYIMTQLRAYCILLFSYDLLDWCLCRNCEPWLHQSGRRFNARWAHLNPRCALYLHLLRLPSAN